MRGGWSIGTKRNECSPHLCSLEIEHFGDCCDFVGFLTGENLARMIPASHPHAPTACG